MVVVSHISIGLNASVLEALRVIENGSAQIALVVDDKKVFAFWHPYRW